MAEQNNDQAQVQEDVKLNDQAEAEQLQQDQDLQKRLAWTKEHNSDLYEEISGNADLSHAEIVIMLDDADVPQADDIDETDDASDVDPAGQVDAGTSNEPAQYGETDEPVHDAGAESVDHDDSDTPADGDLTLEPQSTEALAVDTDPDTRSDEEKQQDADDANRDAQAQAGVENADQKAPEDGAQTDGGFVEADTYVSQPDADKTATSTIDEPTDEKKDIQNAEPKTETTDHLEYQDDPRTQPAKDEPVGNPDETPTTDPHAVDPTAPQNPAETVGTDPVAESSAYSIDGQPEAPEPGADVVKTDESDVDGAGLAAQQPHQPDTFVPSNPQEAVDRSTSKVDAPIEGAGESQANQPTPTDGRMPDEVDQKPQAKDKEAGDLPQTPGDNAAGTSDGVNSLTAPEATDLVTSKTHKSDHPAAHVVLDTSAQANDFVESDKDDVRNNPGPNPANKSSVPTPGDVMGDRAAAQSVASADTQGSVPVQRLSDTLDTYVTEMAVNKSNTEADGGNYQRQLYRAIQNVIYTKDTGDFVSGMNLLLDKIDEHSTGVFSERNAFRFWPHITLPQSERLEFENLMRLFLNLGPKDSRKESLKHTDLGAALQYTKDDTVRERLLAYVKKITG